MPDDLKTSNYAEPVVEGDAGSVEGLEPDTEEPFNGDERKHTGSLKKKIQEEYTDTAERLQLDTDEPLNGNGHKRIESLKGKVKEEYTDIKDYLKILLRKKLILEPYTTEQFGPLVTFDGMEGYSEVERYWVDKPYAFVSILLHGESREYLYFVAEPELSMFERMLLETVYENILDTLTLYDTSEDRVKNDILEEKTLELIDGYSVDISMLSLHKILYYIKRDYLGYERINALMRDPHIEDISCDGVDVPVFLYHRRYQNIQTNILFDGDRLDTFIQRLAQECGKQISIGEPLMNSTLPEGSRLNATLGREITFRGGSFTIRKFRDQAFTPADLIKSGTFSSEMLAYLWLAVENNKSMIFAGATAAGKTSSLNAVSLFIPPMAKIVSIEDTHELVLHHANWIGNITRESFSKTASVRDIDMFELLRQALRQRPEFIIVGEIRGPEALTLFQAMSTGHTTYSTMHADSVHTVISRLEGEPINVPRVMIQALDILCIQTLVHVGGERVRRVDMLVEFMGLDPQTGDLRFNDLYRWDPKTDIFKGGGSSSVLNAIMARRGWDEKKLQSEIENREKILRHMVDRDLDEYDIVSLIQRYYIDPENVMNEVEKGIYETDL